MPIGGKKCKVRKRACSSSSSSSLLLQNYRLKRAVLVGKRGGSSSTPVPMWKLMSSKKSPSLENDCGLFKYLPTTKDGERGKISSVSARKLAATLWEINGLPSPRLKRENLEVEIVRKERTLSLGLIDSSHYPVSEEMDQPKVGSSHKRRASAGSQKLLKGDGTLEGGAKSLHNCLVEVDHQTQNHARSPSRNITGTKNRLKDVYNSLTTSKELLKVMSRIWRFEQQSSTSSSTSLSLVSALKFELDRACNHIHKLIQEQRTNHSEIDIFLKQFEEEKLLWKLKEQDKIHSAVTSVAGELEIEKKLRRQTERLNKKLGKELAEAKESLLEVTKELESEKRAREILEQVCDELARGIGDDRAEVEELKRQSEKVREEVEKEREMLQLADVLREERVQMKLTEAKYQFEEKNELVDKLKNELEAYLKSKKGEEGDNGSSPSYEKIKELKKYLRETLPSSYQYQENGKEDIDVVKKDDEEEDDDDDDDDSADSDFHSIELNVDNISKSFQWSGASKNESKKNSIDKSKGSIKKLNIIEWEFKNNKQENLDVFDGKGLSEFASRSRKREIEDEMERYNMIKDLRDHIIVSGSRIASSQDLASPGKNFGQKSVSSNEPNGVVC
ncbi:hypothetical protein ACJIZ3_012157 [Penstemon smallii]|uniref:Uncharacterized protein n=1 Tax=Penstemon smallii TaxID=265156 RepID=A0ABD3UMI1_9LAMI